MIVNGSSFLPNWNYPNGGRSKRATEAGYWKTTGNDSSINSWSAGVKSRSPELTLIGKRKTLVFYKGRAKKGKKGEKTSWIIHEYRVTENALVGKSDGAQGVFVLCRLFDKSDKNLGNSNCDEMDAKNGDSDFDNIEQSDLSPTITTMSSSEETQNAGGAVVPFEAALNQGIPALDIQEKPQPLPGSIAKQPVNTEMLLAHKADNSTYNPSMPEEIRYEKNMASDEKVHEADVVASEVDPLLQASRMFDDPAPEPPEYRSFLDAYNRQQNQFFSGYQGWNQQFEFASGGANNEGQTMVAI
ncbi:uncharacterized protein LOC143875997 [Tasmannia lanceolata]|uniref:uncharacterized protein LOC143875997 n=1 Tax=Tasmannia lanceolata TaxID=3420 RepID=UPI004063B5E0